MPETKKCPACAEEIKLEAKKCRYCGEEFEKKENEGKINKLKVWIEGNLPNHKITGNDKNILYVDWTRSNFSILLFIILLILRIVPGVIYAIVCMIKPTITNKGKITIDNGGKVIKVEKLNNGPIFKYNKTL